MEIDDIKRLFTISPKENLKDNCELKCPECEKWSSHKEWKESSVSCEECGEHTAMRCPVCDEDFDHVFSNNFECKLAN